MHHTARCEHHAVRAEGVGNILWSMILTFFHFSAIVFESCHPTSEESRARESRARAHSIRIIRSRFRMVLTSVSLSARFFLTCRNGIAEACGTRKWPGRLSQH